MDTDAMGGEQPTEIPPVSAAPGADLPPARAWPYGAPPGYGYLPTPYGAPPGYVPPGYPPPPEYGYPPPYPGYALVPPMPGQPGGAYTGDPYSGPHRPGVGPWPQGIGDVLGTTFRVYFRNFWRLALLGLGVTLLPALLCSGVDMALAWAEGWDVTRGSLGQHLYTSGTSPIAQWLQHSPSPMQIALVVGIGLGVLMLYLVLAAWATASLAWGARELVRGLPVQVGRAMRVGLGRMLKVLGPTLLVVVIEMTLLNGAEAPLWLSTAASMGLIGSGGMGSAAAMAVPGVCFGFVIYLALLVGLVYILVRLSLAPYAAACDGLSPGRAVGWSWSLTSRNWWRTFMPMAVVGIIVQLISWAGISVEWFSLIAHYLVVVPVLVALSTPLRAALRVVIYCDLRLRRQGFPALARELELPGFAPGPAGPMAGATPSGTPQSLP